MPISKVAYVEPLRSFWLTSREEQDFWGIVASSPESFAKCWLEHEIHETSELPKSSMITIHIGSWHDSFMIRSTIKRIYIERMVTGNTTVVYAA